MALPLFLGSGIVYLASTWGPVSLLGSVLRLILGCSTNVPLPAFVTQRQCICFPSSPPLFLGRRGRPLANYFKAGFRKHFRARL